MRRTIETVGVVLLTGTMLLGCGAKIEPGEPQDVTQGEQAHRGKDYRTNVIRDKDETDTSAVGRALEVSRKCAELATKLVQLQEKYQDQTKTSDTLQKEAAKLKLELGRAEQELTDANMMLLEQQKELEKWKGNVLGFRDEMRRSQKAQLEATTRLFNLISGRVGMEEKDAKAPPASAAAKTEEKTGETVQ